MSPVRRSPLRGGLGPKVRDQRGNPGSFVPGPLDRFASLAMTGKGTACSLSGFPTASPRRKPGSIFFSVPHPLSSEV